MDIDDCCSSSSSSISESEKVMSETELQKYCQNAIFIDLRGFRSGFGRFVCKEFCLIDSDGNIYHKFIKSSFPAHKLKFANQLKIEYEEKYGHRIPYDYGDTNIVKLIADILPKLDANKTIFVRDAIVRHYLKYIFRNYCQFDDDWLKTVHQMKFDTSSISEELQLLPFCDFHNAAFGWSSGPCAKNITLKLRYIFAKLQKNQENFDD